MIPSCSIRRLRWTMLLCDQKSGAVKAVDEEEEEAVVGAEREEVEDAIGVEVQVKSDDAIETTMMTATVIEKHACENENGQLWIRQAYLEWEREKDLVHSMR